MNPLWNFLFVCWRLWLGEGVGGRKEVAKKKRKTPENLLALKKKKIVSFVIINDKPMPETVFQSITPAVHLYL